MDRKLILLLVILITAVIFSLSKYPITAPNTRYPNLNLAPIPVQTDNSLGVGNRGVGQCTVHSNSYDLQPAAPLFDGSGIFQDTHIKGLIQATDSAVVDSTACTISYRGLPS